MHKLKIIPQAQKDLDTLSAKIFNRIKSAILSLSENPRPNGAIKLSGQEGYRIREGDYRILYRIDDNSREIYIYRLKHRREVYR